MRGNFSAICLTVFAVAPEEPAEAQQSNPVDGTAVSATCGGDVTDAQYAAMPKAKREARLACMTRATAHAMAKSLPNKVDSETTLVRIEAKGMRLIYHYRLDLLKEDVEPDAMEFLTPGVRENVCRSADMRGIVAAGGSYQYFWTDRAGKGMAELLVDAC